jgi:DNA-binding transcriptional LysR family regulator
MELRDVKIFLALSEELHFSRAAKRLYLSQGRVSQAIRALEREVGGELFERTSRQVRLTAIGRRFAAGARQGHDTLMRTLRDCQAMARAERGRLRIGYSATVGGGFAAEVAEAFEAHHPEFMVTVNAIRVFRLNSALDNDEADVILAWSPGGSGEALRSMDLTVGPVLAQVQRGLLLPDDHPLASRCEVSLDDIADYELLWPPDAIATP